MAQAAMERDSALLALSIREFHPNTAIWGGYVFACYGHADLVSRLKHLHGADARWPQHLVVYLPRVSTADRMAMAQLAFSMACKLTIRVPHDVHLVTDNNFYLGIPDAAVQAALVE
jgi:hypothetical protein